MILKNNDARMTLVQHLTDLRRCLIRSIIGLGIGLVTTLYFAKDIFLFLQKPLQNALPTNSSFIATTPLEAVITYLQVALLAGLFLTSPYLLYQVWLFVAPGLYAREKKLAFLFVSLTSFFFIGGAVFGYFVIFPVGFKFFVTTLEGTNITLLPRMEDYFGFIAKMLLTFGCIFETPLILISLSLMGILPLPMLRKARRYVLVLVFLIAGVLTPGPDVFSQFLLAVPLLALYELSLIFIWILGKKKTAVSP